MIASNTNGLYLAFRKPMDGRIGLGNEWDMRGTIMLERSWVKASVKSVWMNAAQHEMPYCALRSQSDARARDKKAQVTRQ
jgi:hypothetical protein